MFTTPAIVPISSLLILSILFLAIHLNIFVSVVCSRSYSAFFCAHELHLYCLICLCGQRHWGLILGPVEMVLADRCANICPGEMYSALVRAMCMQHLGRRVMCIPAKRVMCFQYITVYLTLLFVQLTCYYWSYPYTTCYICIESQMCNTNLLMV